MALNYTGSRVPRSSHPLPWVEGRQPHFLDRDRVRVSGYQLWRESGLNEIPCHTKTPVGILLPHYLQDTLSRVPSHCYPGLVGSLLPSPPYLSPELREGRYGLKLACQKGLKEPARGFLSSATVGLLGWGVWLPPDIPGTILVGIQLVGKARMSVGVRQLW